MASTAMNMNDQRSTEVIVIAWVFTGIATATVAMKIFARAHITKQLGWDDFFIFFSMVGQGGRLPYQKADDSRR
jgi:hypothetical protein